MEARTGKREVNVAVLVCGRKNGMCSCSMASAAMTAVLQWKERAITADRWTFMLLYLFACAWERGSTKRASECREPWRSLC
jgi:hypothetical protein